jgi:hypothetical protein
MTKKWDLFLKLHSSIDKICNILKKLEVVIKKFWPDKISN